MGFKKGDKFIFSSKNEWEGPSFFEFLFFENRTKTDKYKCPIKGIAGLELNDVFDLYIPHFMIPRIADRMQPKYLLVKIGKSCEGFRRVSLPGENDQSFMKSCIYNYSHENALTRTTKYSLITDDQKYNLNLSHQVVLWGGDVCPPLILSMQVALPG